MREREITEATIEMAGETIRGTYWGGGYIDLHFGNGPAFSTINVWDYVKDKPTIPNTEAAVRAEMIEWAEAAGEDLAHDLANYHETV